MLKVFKNTSFRKFLIFFSFIAVGLAPKLAHASIWSKIASLPVTIPGNLVNVVFGIFAGITQVLLVLGNKILIWVLSPGFIGLSYTNPAGNPIIETGLSITKGFVNMFLVLILVYIALATILRIAGYGTKKLLITFVIVALLVNFTHILCGVVVDASNIAMNFFIEGIGETGGATLTNKLSNIYQGLAAGMFDGANWEIQGMISTMARLSTIVVVNLFTFLIFLLFAFIFIARYVVIWILVILSPLAFACYILPNTRQFAIKWWRNLLQWSFIGVVCAFFLYLGMQLANLGPDTFGEPEGLAASVLPYTVPLVFLVGGFIFGLQTSAVGATAVVNFARTRGKQAGKWGAKQTLGRALASQKGQAAAKKAAKFRFGIKKAADIDGPWKKAAAGAGYYASSPLRWMVRAGGRGALQYGASMERDISKEMKDIENKYGKDKGTVAAAYADQLKQIPAIQWQRKIAFGRKLAELKGGKGLEKLGNDELKEIMRLTARYNPGKFKDIYKYKPEMIEDKDPEVRKTIATALFGAKPGEHKNVKSLVDAGMSEAEAIKTAAFEEAVDDLKPDDINKLTKNTLNKVGFQKAAAKKKPWDFIRKLGDAKGGEGLNYLETVQNVAEQELGLEEIAKSNPSLLRSPYSSGGRMFMREWSSKNEQGKTVNLSKENIEEIIKTEQEKVRAEEKRKAAEESATVEEIPKEEEKKPKGSFGVGKGKSTPRGRPGVDKKETPPEGRPGVDKKKKPPQGTGNV